MPDAKWAVRNVVAYTSGGGCDEHMRIGLASEFEMDEKHPDRNVTPDMVKTSVHYQQHSYKQLLPSAQANNLQSLNNMGQGGFLLLYNATPYAWRRSYTNSYQMNAWNFPESIPAFTGVRVYVEFNEGTGKHKEDSAADVKYELLGCPSGQSEIWIAIKFRDFLARFPEFPVKMGTKPIPRGSELSLGWRHDGETVYILSGVYPDMQFLTNVV
ncbi:hypothetical protein NUW54_g8722 [Trametes sanguinea]|uniref:Uncharacterized protein n=1 Tax=Trametes sanguinea TaxID=158606 RepID=A0ACC1PDL8_9APHY|nr:hypothetical protein NUW54_g8722 [Trametes sanguinea]